MSSLLQLALAFIVVLVIPGFAASLALFPRLNQIDITERLAISIGLSITIVIAIGMLLSYGTSITGYAGGITALSLAASLAFVTFCGLLIWALRATSLAITARRHAARQREAVVGLGRHNQPKRARVQRSASKQLDVNKYQESGTPRGADTGSKREESRPKRGA